MLLVLYYTLIKRFVNRNEICLNIFCFECYVTLVVSGWLDKPVLPCVLCFCPDLISAEVRKIHPTTRKIHKLKLHCSQPFASLSIDISFGDKLILHFQCKIVYCIRGAQSPPTGQTDHDEQCLMTILCQTPHALNVDSYCLAVQRADILDSCYCLMYCVYSQRDILW